MSNNNKNNYHVNNNNIKISNRDTNNNNGINKKQDSKTELDTNLLIKKLFLLLIAKIESMKLLRVSQE